MMRRMVINTKETAGPIIRSPKSTTAATAKSSINNNNNNNNNNNFNDSTTKNSVVSVEVKNGEQQQQHFHLRMSKFPFFCPLTISSPTLHYFFNDTPTQARIYPHHHQHHHRRNNSGHPNMAPDADHQNHTLNGEKTKRPKLSHCHPAPAAITDAEIRAEFSHHDAFTARINNGSFGSCPESVLAAQRRWQLRFLRQPDEFYFHLLKPAVLRSRFLIRALINARHVDEVSLVDNATTAAAIVLQRAAWSFSEGRYARGDAAVMLHYAYGAVKKSVQAYVTRAGGHVIEVELPFPVRSEEEIITAFRKALARGKAEGRRVRLAVIDHVTSMPSVVIPVKALVKICREEGVDQVFVDAAHGIGCVDVDVEDIGADFYTSNLHKWMFCPPGSAFLYCRKTDGSSGGGDDLHHPVVSHEYGNGLPMESTWIGTRDYSPQLVVPDVLEFVGRFPGGMEGIKRRNHEAVVEMGKMLVEAWGTRLGTPPEMCASMIMVGLPACLGIASEVDSLKLRTHLRECFGVEVPIYFRPPKDGEVGVVTGYARISHQVYNEVEDYYKFRNAVNQLVKDGFVCSSLSN